MVSDQEFQQLRSRMAQLEGQVKFLYKHLGVVYAPETTPLNDSRIIELIQKGKKVEAVKLYRDLSNAGLVEANQAIEDIKHRLGL